LRGCPRSLLETFKISLTPPLPNKEAEAPSQSHDVLTFHRHFIDFPAPLRQRLEYFYARLNRSSVDRENVRKVTRDLMPFAGFPNGCIYLFNIGSSSLFPHLSIGDKTRVYDPVYCSRLDTGRDPIAVAFRSSSPITNSGEGGDGDQPYIAASFGYIRRVGVLYLELGAELKELHITKALKIFSVLNQALQDSLNVE
jgi:hypothetical protein